MWLHRRLFCGCGYSGWGEGKANAETDGPFSSESPCRALISKGPGGKKLLIHEEEVPSPTRAY